MATGYWGLEWSVGWAALAARHQVGPSLARQACKVVRAPHKPDAPAKEELRPSPPHKPDAPAKVDCRPSLARQACRSGSAIRAHLGEMLRVRNCLRAPPKLRQRVPQVCGRVLTSPARWLPRRRGPGEESERAREAAPRSFPMCGPHAGAPLSRCCQHRPEQQPKAAAHAPEGARWWAPPSTTRELQRRTSAAAPRPGPYLWQPRDDEPSLRCIDRIIRGIIIEAAACPEGIART
jgi:hypothetical protein